MSLFIKKHWSKTAKIAGAIFFAVLMFVNVKLTTDTNTNGDIDLFGLKLSLFVPSAYATGGTGCNGLDCAAISCFTWGSQVCTYMYCNPGPGGFFCFYYGGG